MTRRRSLMIAALVIVGALAAAIIAVAVGADAIGLVLGIAVGAAALVLLAGAWLEPMRRRQRRAERVARREARAQGRRTRRAVHAAERRLFTQIESLGWLRQMLDLPLPLAPTRGAAASPDLLLELVRIIDRSRPAMILELGSGVSSVVMGARCKAIGRGHVFALEHDAGYAAATRTELHAQGLDAVVTVLDAPIEDVLIDGQPWPWYTLLPEVPDGIGLLLVDGPPAGIGKLARYPALPLLQDRLRPGATIVVDDGDRPEEREMVRRWQAEIDGLEARYLDHAKGTWQLGMPE